MASSSVDLQDWVSFQLQEVLQVWGYGQWQSSQVQGSGSVCWRGSSVWAVTPTVISMYGSLCTCCIIKEQHGDVHTHEEDEGDTDTCPLQFFFSLYSHLHLLHLLYLKFSNETFRGKGQIKLDLSTSKVRYRLRRGQLQQHLVWETGNSGCFS